MLPITAETLLTFPLNFFPENPSASTATHLTDNKSAEIALVYLGFDAPFLMRLRL